MRFYLILIFATLSDFANSQSLDTIKSCQLDSINGKKVYTIVESQPEFKDGGIQGFYNYIGKIRLDKNNAEEGRVRVSISFVIDEKGNMQNVCTTNNIVLTDDILMKLDNWKAGTQKGIPVPVRMTLNLHLRN